jgi:hypothetical protein
MALHGAELPIQPARRDCPFVTMVNGPLMARMIWPIGNDRGFPWLAVLHRVTRYRKKSVDQSVTGEKNSVMRVQTERLLQAPIGPEHAGDLYRLHQDPWVATW